MCKNRQTIFLQMFQWRYTLNVKILHLSLIASSLERSCSKSGLTVLNFRWSSDLF